MASISAIGPSIGNVDLVSILKDIELVIVLQLACILVFKKGDIAMSDTKETSEDLKPFSWENENEAGEPDFLEGVEPEGKVCSLDSELCEACQ